MEFEISKIILLVFGVLISIIGFLLNRIIKTHEKRVDTLFQKCDDIERDILELWKSKE